jgi:D-beta-D-heptose 7-phosphate kinase/D-beta-D-heptose 1-phosphate adenosyltransferase
MRILVLGGQILDINHICETTRTAAEADIPIYKTIDTQYILGGSANVANNLTNIGCDVTLLSIIGKDNNGETMKKLLNKNNIKHELWIDNNRKTTTKTRIFHKNKIVNRFDIECTDEISKEIENQIMEFILMENYINNIDAIIFSDYTQGILPKTLCNSILNFCNENKIYSFVDPKPEDYHKFHGCFCFKPNMKEATQMIQHLSKKNDNIPLDVNESMIKSIKKELNCENIIITMSGDGIYCNNDMICDDYSPIILDVTGAGDIVLSVITYFFLYCGNLKKACEIADKIARKSVETMGNYRIDMTDIQPYLDEKTPIIYMSQTPEKLDEITHRLSKKKIVFTNGCFDILHSAHIRLLQYSKKQGDILIVGINSDLSVRKLKGTLNGNRPINNINERCDILQQLGFIDYIVVFDEDTPYEIVKKIRPSIMIKGGDYKPEDIPGKEFTKEIIIFEYISGISTSKIVENIQCPRQA